MIWATVISQSCLCWLYSTLLYLAAKNIITLISVMTIWWGPCCRVVSCVIERGCLLWPVHSLGKTLLAFALLHSVLQGKICLLLKVFLDFILLHSRPLEWKGHLFGVLVPEGLVGFHRVIQFQFLQHYWLGIDLDSWGIEWFALEMNRNHSFVLRLHPSTAFQTLVDSDGYYISSKEFLPTVVDIMVIWVKFTHSCPF